MSLRKENPRIQSVRNAIQDIKKFLKYKKDYALKFLIK